ncbi:MAG: hypothetical protein A3K83_03535 [Omnitrophica WOR_2 bacterium RBG_13_44_8b]|nr:MAG: hypothetical protein A3K83_03535 [Omnitrophica WOR_2 bacterium RBG_13_44_8b]
MKTDRRGFLTLLGMVMALAIIGILYYVLMKVYFKNPDSYNKTPGIEGEAALPNIDISNPLNAKETTRAALKNIQKQQQSQLDEVMQK